MLSIMRLLLLPILAVCSFSAFAQDPISFTDALKPHLQKYNAASDKAFEQGDIEKGQRMFDSLVQHYLVGSRFQDYQLRSVGGGKVKLNKLKKPVFLITYASWCVLHKGEISALNKLSRQYGKNVEFVVLFWDKKEHVKPLARKFGGRIKVCYANESYRNDARVVASLKHTLGFPTSYFLTSSLEVADIKRGGATVPPGSTFRVAFAENYRLFQSRIADFLVKKDLIKPQLADLPD